MDLLSPWRRVRSRSGVLSAAETRLLSLLFFLALCFAGGCGMPHGFAVEANRARPAAAATKINERVPFNDICPLAQDNRIPVLMFHDIIKDRGRGSVWFDCSAPEFQAIMDWIQAEGITPISLDQLYDHLTSGAKVPDKSIVLTFDDNYQGFYDNALPILEKYHFPAAMFVHTDFVGSQENRPKMTWDELAQLVKGGLITIGSHTLSHPADITQESPSDQEREITESKKVLEDHLKIPIQYFAYPDGKNDAATQDYVRAAGYKMAFTMANGPAEESPNIVAVDRYIHTRYLKAWDDREAALECAPAAVVQTKIKDAPITYERGRYAGLDLALIKGGIPSSMRSATREGVLQFTQDAGASAGINGTFFAMVTISGTSNEMVGPCYASNEAEWVPDLVPDRLERIRNRPMVVWGPSGIAVFPFQGGQMNTEAPIRWLMPDFTDAFVAGGWLVHDGKPRSRDELTKFSARDLMDYRRRAFFGLMEDGTVVLGASIDSVSSVDISQAAAAAGVKEAFMMDSGFSTSLAYGDKIIASGHSTPTMPSRPVPHAIVLKGILAMDPNAITVPQPLEARAHRRRKKRKSGDGQGAAIRLEPNSKTAPSATSNATPDTSPAPPDNPDPTTRSDENR